MALITPQDLNNSISVLEFLLAYAKENNDILMQEEVEKLINDYNQVMLEPDISDMTLLPYNRKDSYSILEYLKLQAEQLSDGRWTDFSDSDIGTVFLKLMSYLADMNNFQIDKAVSELYLNTCTERASALALCSLIGYEPRHYQSAYSDIVISTAEGITIPDGEEIPAFSVFTDSSTNMKYCNLTKQYMFGNEAHFRVYQGIPTIKTYTINDINTLGRIILQDYTIGTNTISLKINGIEYDQVEDVRFISGQLGFSVHISEDKYLYIQLPSYWPDVISKGSTIEISYLITDGADGRIGKNVLTRIEQLSNQYSNKMIIKSNTASQGGYNPETVDEMRINVPKRARTMNTIVTINDFEEVGTEVLGISDISALDYNDPSSGLIQPDDYYKVNLYVLPDADTYDATDTDLIKYRNTIIKDRSDWTIEDMSKVAEGLDTYSKNSISGTTITLQEVASLYTLDDIVPAIDTGNEANNFIIERVNDVSSITERLVYSISQSNNDYIIKFNNNWKTFVKDGYKINIYYKREQVLTERGQLLREYIDERRLTSLKITYYNLDIVQPTIIIDVYMDKDDIRFKTSSAAIKDFIINK